MFALRHGLLINASFYKLAGRLCLRQVEKFFKAEGRSKGDRHGSIMSDCL